MVYINNYVETVTTTAGQFMIEQRNVGFAENDGSWIVSQLPELYWSSYGTLRRRRPSAFLGVFNSRVAVRAAIDNAELQSEKDEAVVSMGRVSC